MMSFFQAEDSIAEFFAKYGDFNHAITHCKMSIQVYRSSYIILKIKMKTKGFLSKRWSPYPPSPTYPSTHSHIPAGPLAVY
jgi:hypothetical protein